MYIKYIKYFSIGAFIIYVLYISIDSESTKYYKKECTKFGYLEKSKEFKECHKNSKNFFQYGLNYNVDKVYLASSIFNEKIKTANKKQIINKNNYTDVVLLDFIYSNFSTDKILLQLKNPNILKKKLKFKVAFYISSGSDYKNPTIHITLPIRMTFRSQSNDKTPTSVMMDTNLDFEFQNTEIKSKVLDNYRSTDWISNYQLRYIEHTIYGYFDDLYPFKYPDDILGVRPIFYVEDIVFNEASLDKNKIRELLIKNNENQKKYK